MNKKIFSLLYTETTIFRIDVMLENYGNSRGWGGGGYDKYLLEIPAGWWCKLKCRPCGGSGEVWIFFGTTQFSF